MLDRLDLISVGDVHASDVSPGSRIDDYRATVFGKLDKIREIAIKAKVGGVIFTGDIFDKKVPLRNSHSLVRGLIDTFQSFPCPCYSAVGNHDLTNDRLDSLPKQPLGVVFQSGSLIELKPEGIVREVGSLKVRLAATSYNEIDPLPECRKVVRGGCDALVTAGHFFATPEGGPFFKHTAVSYAQLAETETDIWVLGHIHTDQGIGERGNKYFINIGSLTRGTLDDDNLTRKVKIGHISIVKEASATTWKVQQVVLPVAPVDQVFDLEKRREKEVERQEIEKFVQGLESEFSRTTMDSADPQVLLRGLGLPDRVFRETLKRIEAAGRD